MINVGLVGGTGYTGVELLRILVQHPEVNLHTVTSRGEDGRPVADLFPNLRPFTDICFSVPQVETLSECDLVFFATPHGVAMDMAPTLVEAGVRVIDLGADFRIYDTEEWSKWYGLEHTCKDLMAQAVYGLPEVNREQIKQAKLVGNPGCYPTAVQLGYLPLIKNGLVDTDNLIADCKSGASGAGRQAKMGMLLCEVSESFSAYGASGHRHLPEIKQGLSFANQNQPVGLTFVPHLTPMVRGIHATLYAKLKDTSVDLQALYQDFYKNEHFVDVMPEGSHPATRNVKGSNFNQIAIHRPQGGDTVVVLSVIDNLVKGAAGQAIQNMNIMFGLPEHTGMTQPAMLP
ncbi:N-acetyl-gamma-glutamyl-phosphate reductase [Bermanella sp. R86510]|uniref:N-acetyl-gamma-glutamyl-phosphate reductase n=1 Tax=unclassified Bermanella TaxID=2627862 RepID=UPI0037C84EB5